MPGLENWAAMGVTANNPSNLLSDSSVASGQATLVAGTVTVSGFTGVASLTTAAVILLAYSTRGGTVNPVYVGVITAGTSFTIVSANAADTSKINWYILSF